MTYLILGIITLIGIHLLPAFVSIRDRLLDLFGRAFYSIVFCAVALVGLGLIIFGKYTTLQIDVWDPPFLATLVPVIVMPVVFILLVAAYLPTNIKLRVRHPMLLGVMFWSIAHLAINGDLASIILFGSFGLYSVFAMWSANRRGLQAHKRRSKPIKTPGQYSDLDASARRYVSYSKLMQKHVLTDHRVSFFKDFAAIFLGLVAFTIVLFLHNTLFSVSMFH